LDIQRDYLAAALLTGKLHVADRKSKNKSLWSVGRSAEKRLLGALILLGASEWRPWLCFFVVFRLFC
jgi:hypothetical protein